MKVAVCISGQPRLYKKGFETIHENLIKPNDADVFIHLWHDVDKENEKYDVPQRVKKQKRNSKIDPGVLSEIYRLYQPKAMKVEPQKDFTERKYAYNKGGGVSSGFNTYSMFYSIQKANELKSDEEKKYGFKQFRQNYDVVVRCRTDLNIKTKIDLSEFRDDFDKMNVPPVFVKHNDHCPDIFMFSSSENMNMFCDLYYHIDEMYDYNKVRKWTNEIFVHKFLKTNNIQIKWQNDLNIDFVKE